MTTRLVEEEEKYLIRAEKLDSYGRNQFSDLEVGDRVTQVNSRWVKLTGQAPQKTETCSYRNKWRPSGGEGVIKKKGAITFGKSKGLFLEILTT